MKCRREDSNLHSLNGNQVLNLNSLSGKDFPRRSAQLEGLPLGETRLILVVEDNDLTREGLATLLNQEGYRVALAGDGEEALNHLRGGLCPDLILLDMLMPVLDGWHFLERLRPLRLQPPLPIVITTATNLTREWAEAHECQGFLRKPIEPDQLLEEVRRCLGEP
jgi:two-component system, OmpR family, response regulator CpxR